MFLAFSAVACSGASDGGTSRTGGECTENRECDSGICRGETSGAASCDDGVGSGQTRAARFMTNLGAQCSDDPKEGYPMSAGNLRATTRLCSARLSFHAEEKAGGSGCLGGQNARGPSWRTRYNDGCPLDDTGLNGSMGLSNAGANGADKTDDMAAMGFGAGLQLNSHSPPDRTGRDDGKTALRMYVR